MADHEDALEQCETIIDLIDNIIPDHAWSASPDFFEQIKEKAVNMAEWIEVNARVTPKMVKALDNMERGIRKWIR